MYLSLSHESQNVLSHGKSLIFISDSDDVFTVASHEEGIRAHPNPLPVSSHIMSGVVHSKAISGCMFSLRKKESVIFLRPVSAE